VFHFKKFSIDDSSAAMKIGTDAVLLGAWVACEDEMRVLDIGTGSGILALMMAQRNRNAKIDAVELDEKAAKLAKQNVMLSPWHEQIEVFSMSIQEFAKQKKHKYSLILCNPPFFSASLKSSGEARNLARHNDTLPVDNLLQITSELLTQNGKASFIFPSDDFEKWKQEAFHYLLFPSRVTFLKSTDEHRAHRVLVTFGRKPVTEIDANELVIYTTERMYSPEYLELTKDFYLQF
jgi:tRNA1Val (adenine37-N6)-methyltransferase